MNWRYWAAFERKWEFRWAFWAWSSFQTGPEIDPLWAFQMDGRHTKLGLSLRVGYAIQIHSMALHGCALLLASAVPPAKITCFNGLLHPTFSPFPSLVKPFVNCTSTSSFSYRATPLPPKFVYPDPIPEFAEAVSSRIAPLSPQIDSGLGVDFEVFSFFLCRKPGNSGNIYRRNSQRIARHLGTTSIPLWRFAPR